MRIGYVLAIVVLTLGCESADARYGRLDKELMLAKLDLGNAEARFDSVMRTEKPLASNSTLGPQSLAYADTVQAARARVALAEREMARFKGGR